jgi:hypothetical protein
MAKTTKFPLREKKRIYGLLPQGLSRGPRGLRSVIRVNQLVVIGGGVGGESRCGSHLVLGVNRHFYLALESPEATLQVIFKVNYQGQTEKGK